MHFEQVVIFESPLVIVPKLRLFASFVLPQAPQNVTVVLGINSLTLLDEFTVNNLENVKENHLHVLGCAPTAAVTWNQADRRWQTRCHLSVRKI